jgi:hypothetical protein
MRELLLAQLAKSSTLSYTVASVHACAVVEINER